MTLLDLSEIKLFSLWEDILISGKVLRLMLIFSKRITRCGQFNSYMKIQYTFIKQTGNWQIEKELHIIKKGFHQWHGQNHLAGLEKLNYGEESPCQTDPWWEGLKGLEAGRCPGILMITARLFHWIWRHWPESKSRCDYPGKCEVGT